MKFKNPLLIVKNLGESKRFYKETLGLRVIMDFGANVTLTGGVCLQTIESWQEFINVESYNIHFGGNDSELYFEEENFEEFIEKLKLVKNINYVHDVLEHRWGQRVIRFYDPDKHIIEVGEDIRSVCRRFVDSGMVAEDIAKRMDVPIKFVDNCIR